MITFARPGGYVVRMDVNREFECCGLYIGGMDYPYSYRHEGLTKKWQTELAMQGRDYAAATRTAHRMQKLGLTCVDVRMNDKVEFVTPQHPDYEETKQDFITYNDWTSGMDSKERECMIRHLLNHGLSDREAEDYCDRSIRIAEYFAANPRAGHTSARGQLISYGKKTIRKQILLLDLYGVIIRESRGNLIPYTFAHFEEKEYARMEQAFRDDRLFTKCQNGEMSSDEFLSGLGYENPARTMRDYLEHFLTLDTDFLSFAEQYHTRYGFVLLSNDVKEWNRYIFEFYGLHRYFHDCIVSGDISLRKPAPALFAYALARTRRSSEPH